MTSSDSKKNEFDASAIGERFKNRLARAAANASPIPANYVPPTPPASPHTDGLRNALDRAASNPYRAYERPEAKGLYFRQKQVRLEGYKFIGCRFDNCELQVTSHNFELIECVIDPSCKVTYVGDVLNVIKLFTGTIGDWVYGSFPGFTPIRNPDGSITISSLRT